MTFPLFLSSPTRAPANSAMFLPRSELRHRQNQPVTPPNPPKPPVPPDPLPGDRTRSRFIVSSLNLTKIRSTTPPLHQRLLFISFTPTALLPRLDLRVSYTINSPRFRLELLPHAGNAAIIGLFILYHLRPPASTSRNGNRRTSELASASPTNTNGLCIILRNSPTKLQVKSTGSESLLTGSLHLRSALDHIEPTTILIVTIRQYQCRPGSPPPRFIRVASRNPIHIHHNHLKVFSSVTQDKILQATTSSTTVLLEVQPSQPPENTTCNHRNFILLVNFFFEDDDKSVVPQHNPRRISLFPAENQMGLGQLLWLLGFDTCKLPKPIMKKRPQFFRMNMLLTDYFSTTMNFASYAEALVLKAAIEAASRLEIHHLRVFSDSQSLVSQIISDGDVNELKSVLYDMRCLLETFSFIYVSFVLRMAIV